MSDHNEIKGPEIMYGKALAQTLLDRLEELERENAELRKALNDATTSLCTISQQSGRTEELQEMSQVRGYAFSRYSAALDTMKKEQS